MERTCITVSASAAITLKCSENGQHNIGKNGSFWMDFQTTCSTIYISGRASRSRRSIARWSKDVGKRKWWHGVSATRQQSIRIKQAGSLARQPWLAGQGKTSRVTV